MPDESLTVLLITEVATSVTVTLAPGTTAPPASETVPWRVAALWAKLESDEKHRVTMAKRTNGRRGRKKTGALILVNAHPFL